MTRHSIRAIRAIRATRAIRPILALTALSAARAAPAHAATLTVGPGQSYTTLAAAIAASADGDTINVQAGAYVNDFAEITTKISLVAVGGRVTLRATEDLPNQKGILIVDTDTSITGFNFTGAHVSYASGDNGAGIRHQGGALTLTKCWFHNNQEGVLSTTTTSAASVTVLSSEFNHNGVAFGPAAGYEHNLYVNGVGLLDIENSYFHDALVGHEIKSRALNTVINNTRIVDGPNSTSSYSVDLPNGGVASITNTQIEQGRLGQNPTMIAYGEEGHLAANNSLTLQTVLLENDLTAHTPVGVSNAAGIAATADGLAVWGLTPAEIASGPLAVTNQTNPVAEPVISAKHPF